MAEPFFCLWLFPSSKARIWGCAPGEGERVSGRAMERDLAPSVPKRLPTVPAWVCILLPQCDHCMLRAAARQCLLLLPPDVPSCLHQAPQGSPGVLGGASSLVQAAASSCTGTPGCRFFVLFALVTAPYDLLAKPSVWVLLE